MEGRRFVERLGDFTRALSRLAEGLALDSDSSIQALAKPVNAAGQA